MLKTLDILIGLSVVMLLVSMIVTVVTQFFIGLLQMRERNLQKGIANLLKQIHPGMPPNIPEDIARTVLTHPLVSEANGKRGGVIHREELTKLLLELASGEGPHPIADDSRKHLIAALAANGIEPGTIAQKLENVRSLALQLELAHPELTNAARARIAMLEHASSQFIGKINLWFDQTMDRVSARFTAHTRLVTFVVGLVIALVLQLDTGALVSRLSMDGNGRTELISLAHKTASAAENAQVKAAAGDASDQPKANDAKAPNEPKPAASDDNGPFSFRSEADQRAVRDLMTSNIIGAPTSLSDWRGRWNANNALMKVIGILLTAVLLSLGAPFWYNALQNLLRLRSVIAVKDDQQRQERQLSIPAATATAAATVAGSGDATLLGDERGDLTPVA
jgi:hypothetical protein